MAFVGRKEAAAALGFSRQRLEKLIKLGRVVETDDGVDLDQARRARSTMIDPVKVLAANAPGPPPPASDKPGRKPYAVKRGSKKVEDAETGDLIDFATARTNRERANAALAELKYAQESGRLVPVDQVKAKEFEVARKLRDRILGFPAKIQQFLPPEAMKVITDECDVLIRELQEDAARIAERSD